MKVNPLVFLPPLAFAALAGFFIFSMNKEDTGLPSTLVGRDAPQMAVTSVGDIPAFDPAVFADGQVKLVNFWASWCGPCRIEHPHLLELAEGGLPIYGINYKDRPEAAKEFLAELGNPYIALGADVNGRVATEWGVYGVPETYLIDGEGKVLTRIAGPVAGGLLENTLLPALEKARAQ